MPSSLGPIIASSRVTAYAPDIQELETGQSEVTRAPDTPSCGCLTQSLELLKMLSAQHVPQTGLSGSESNETQNATTSGPSHSVLTENKQSIDAVSERLTCPSCAGDSFLLAVLSMTVLKILERYAAAARAQPGGAETTHPEAAKTSRLANSILASSKSQMVVVSRTYNTPRHRGRRAAQLVLRELHHVQGLVNQLSPKLMRPKDRERRDLGPEELWGRLGRAGDHDRGPEAPFSATTLGQIESDVRKSLSALSSEIKNGLRQS
ncbi:putative c6 transcription factor [Diaporthe ampelina]|uniref:Putative c6 transcription factor n=1 Tax=Diaporthe ampelina TaxID=1214573 RepID=A0A0G2H9T0_9PEZI|nr:putative c6 transcription factor [Diaporthe ampelina]